MGIILGFGFLVSKRRQALLEDLGASGTLISKKGELKLETVVLIICMIITFAGIILCWRDIKTIPWRIHYWLMGIVGSECPDCHRRYLHERDMKSCRCGPGREDDRGIGVKCTWNRYSHSGWPPDL